MNKSDLLSAITLVVAGLAFLFSAYAVYTITQYEGRMEEMETVSAEMIRLSDKMRPIVLDVEELQPKIERLNQFLQGLPPLETE